MDSKGNDALLTSKKVSEFNFNYGGIFPVAFGVLMLLGCVLAYIIAVTRGNVEAVLPLISDAAGSPPQNGIFGSIICASGMTGATFMILRYMIVVEKNRKKSNLVTSVNKLSLCVGILSMIGIAIITGYPVNFYRNRDTWLKDVGLPHMVGLIMFSALGLVYIGLQCVLTLFVKPNKGEGSGLPMRIILLFICTAAFVYHMITVPDHMGGISHLYYLNTTDMNTTKVNDTSLLPYPSTLGADLKLPIETGGTYFTAAVTEWAFVFFFCCFFFTFYKEMQQYSLQIVIETQTTPQHASEVPEESKTSFRKSSQIQRNSIQVDPKPAPEMRKFLRRDSTCQTSDEPVKIIIPTKDKINTSNGTSKLALDPEVDARLNKILKEGDKSESKTMDNGTQHSQGTQHTQETQCTQGTQSTQCTQSTQLDEIVTNGKITAKNAEDSEAERKAIEKIDVVVQNAEKGIDDSKDIDDTTKKIDEDEEKPSSCPLAVQ